MTKKTKKETECDALTELPPRDLLLLNDASAARILAQEKLAHAKTRVQLTQITAEAGRLRCELAAREAGEHMAARLKEATADHDAATKSLADLNADIRKTYNLTESHAIDAITGAIIQPES